MTSPNDFNLSTVKDQTHFPDLSGGTHVVALKGLPEVYQSIGDGGRTFGNTLSLNVAVSQSATLPAGHQARIRIKGQGMWHDAPVDANGSPNYEKSSGYRFLQQLRSVLLTLSGSVGKQLSEAEMNALQVQLLTGQMEGRTMLVEAKEKTGRVSKLGYTTYKFSPFQAT
jgi:hypothetical protein